MGIKIIEDQTPDIYLTAAEHARLLDEYNRTFMFYAGTPPSFEHWVAHKMGIPYTVSALLSGSAD